MKVVLLWFVLAVLPIRAAETNTFTTQTLGFSITKPAHWRFIAQDQGAENLGRPGSSDPKVQKGSESPPPMVVLTKYPEPYDQVNPSVKVNVRPLGNFDGANPSALLEMILPTLQKSLRNLKVLEKPAPVRFAGLNAAHLKVTYTLAPKAGRSFPAISELWVVPRGKVFFFIGTAHSANATRADREELQQILRSVKIDPAA